MRTQPRRPRSSLWDMRLRGRRARPVPESQAWQAEGRARWRETDRRAPGRARPPRPFGRRFPREESGRRLQHAGVRQARDVVGDEPVNAQPEQFAGAFGHVHRPSHDDVGDCAQRDDAVAVEKALVDRDPVELLSGKSTLKSPQLARAPDGVDATHREPGKRLEHSPAAGTDREVALAQVRPDGVEHALAELPPRALQVEQELGLWCSRREQLVQLQTVMPRGSDLPAIPEDGKRADRLQVAHLELPAVKPAVGLDLTTPELLGCSWVSGAVARARRDEEGAPPAGLRPRG